MSKQANGRAGTDDVLRVEYQKIRKELDDLKRKLEEMEKDKAGGV